MEKDKENKVLEENKESFIIKMSGTFFPEKYLEENLGMDKSDLSLEEYKEFVVDSISKIYNNLLLKIGDNKVDSIGIWIDFNNGKKIETSFDIETINSIKGYQPDIDPISEFSKMILDEAYKD
ncbi:MAG TPA: hypothetical protein P5513_04960 [Candidatus Diapherotrites archaeon]|nr:hypothetical protein [Candidatus Diapherotrites archaeon]